MRNSTNESNGSAPLLEVDHLAVTFYTPNGTFRAVREATFEIRRGEVLGLVGESGCGKSTVAYAMMGYLPGTAQVDGTIRFEGTDIAHISEQELGDLRGDRIAMVYQDPVTSLNPSMKVGPQIEEVLRRHKNMNAGEARARVVELFENVRLSDPGSMGDRYPHQLSGGQQQRVVIAMALACDPDLLIMDEPTTGLDVTTEATILDLVAELKERVNAGILFVSHNLGVIARVADRVAVMYAGQIVEQASVREVFKAAKHPYTVGLLSCVPKPVGEEGVVLKLSQIPGTVYPASEPNSEACIYAPRCPLAQDSCLVQAPTMEEVGDNHLARCFLWKDVRPDIWGENDLRDQALETHGEPVLRAKNLRRFYGRWQRKYMFFGPRVRPPVRAVNNIDFQLAKGKTLGIVGESGSGKTTVARIVTGLVPRDRGDMDLHGQELAPDVGNRRREQQAAIRMVFQNPTASLNPKLPIGHAITRALRKFAGLSKHESDKRARELLEAVGLDASYLDSSPSELSGGQQQRVAIAGAFAANPDVIVADEAVSALDVSVQAQVLNLLQEHQKEVGTSYIFITHDLGVVRYISDDILVMYAGHVAESGPTESVLTAPFHPYTEALLSAAPVPDPDAKPTEIRLEGAVPTMRERFQGCFFAGRCPRKLGSICDEAPPPAQTGPASPNHVIHCHIPVDELAVLQGGKNPQPAGM